MTPELGLNASVPQGMAPGFVQILGLCEAFRTEMAAAKRFAVTETAANLERHALQACSSEAALQMVDHVLAS